MKKLAHILAVGAAIAGNAFAATAYQALEVIKKDRGDAILKQLVEVRGEAGQPQPQSWTILMADPSARGGVREFVVADGAIASERTPVRGYTVGTGAFPVLNFTRLNVDSGEAFKVANAQSVDDKLGFHSVDYTLRTNDADGSPLWVMHLFDYMGAPVGTLRVSAEDGKVVSPLQVDPDARQKPAAEATPPPAPQPARTTAKATPAPTPVFKGGVFGFVERTSKNIGTTVKKTTLNVAGTVQEALTGEDTISPGATPAP